LKKLLRVAAVDQIVRPPLRLIPFCWFCAIQPEVLNFTTSTRINPAKAGDIPSRRQLNKSTNVVDGRIVVQLGEVLIFAAFRRLSNYERFNCLVSTLAFLMKVVEAGVYLELLFSITHYQQIGSVHFDAAGV